MVVSIIDLGIGNIRSLENTLDLIGVTYQRITSAGELGSAEKVILPGNGAFDAIIGALCENNLASLLKKRISTGMPYLGICVGMQILFTGSDEGIRDGLSLIPSRIKKFKNFNNYAHIGWEAVFTASEHKVGDFYFMHQYRSDIVEDEYQYQHCIFPEVFSCGVRVHNAVGVQFHPEKSGSDGEKFLLDWCNVGV